MGGNGFFRAPGIELVVPRDKWIPVYHIGVKGCRQVAFCMTRKLAEGERMISAIVRLPDGSRPEPGSSIVCSACKKEVKASNGVMLDLSYNKPDQLPLQRKYKTGQKPNGYYRSGSRLMERRNGETQEKT